MTVRRGQERQRTVKAHSRGTDEAPLGHQGSDLTDHSAGATGRKGTLSRQGGAIGSLAPDLLSEEQLPVMEGRSQFPAPNFQLQTQLDTGQRLS